MNPKEFVRTIYLGDRACKKIIVDGWNGRFGIQVDCISRLKEGTDIWNYYTDEDVYDGWLVFSELSSLSIEPSGPVPNDALEIVDVEERDNAFLFTISIGSVGDRGETTEVRIEVEAKDLSIQTNDAFFLQLRE